MKSELDFNLSSLKSDISTLHSSSNRLQQLIGSLPAVESQISKLFTEVTSLQKSKADTDVYASVRDNTTAIN